MFIFEWGERVKKRYKIILLSLVAVVLLGAIVLGIHTYQNWRTEKTISEYQVKIEQVAKSFSETEERTAKLEILKELINEANEYSKTEKPIKEVVQSYKQEIQSMKSCFIEMYDTEVVQNTLSDVATIADKEALDNAKTNLTTLLDTMKSEYELTLSEAEHTEYVAKINSLVEGYTNRVAEIEKAEEEARLKAEAEAKAKAEQEAKAKEQASKSNNSASSNASNNANNSNKNTSSNNAKFNFDPNDDSNLPAGWSHHWSLDENGNKIEGSDTWIDPNGNVYGIGGQFLLNNNDI